MESTQTLLIIVVTVLTVLLLAIGVQVFLILREVQQSVKKMNKMLDDGHTVTGAVASLVDRTVGLSGVAGALGWLASKKRKDKGGKDVR